MHTKTKHREHAHLWGYELTGKKKKLEYLKYIYSINNFYIHVFKGLNISLFHYGLSTITMYFIN
jgi:hypothetical protein